MLLLLQRSPAQEAALRDFIQAAHTPGNPSYHQWLKPAEFGRLYGPADSDVAAVTAWLESHGLTVNQVHAGRLAIEFSGTRGAGERGFSDRRFTAIRSTARRIWPTPPILSVPAALAPVIAGLAPVNDFHPQPQLKVLGQAQFNAKTHQATPQWTYPVGSGVVFLMAPGDFAVQYDINPVYNAGITGSGQSIAIVSASNVDLSMVQAYQSLFGLSANLPQVIVDGATPARMKRPLKRTSTSRLRARLRPAPRSCCTPRRDTALTDGLALAAMRAVEDDLAGVISTSYGECEQQLGQSGNAFWSALWQQAAAQGQTAFVSTGDGGSAGCDDFDTQAVAYDGLQVNGIASTPYNVAVGGTDFYYSQYASTSSVINTQLGTYWYGYHHRTRRLAASRRSRSRPGTTSSASTWPIAATQPIWAVKILSPAAAAPAAPRSIPTGLEQGYPKPAWQTGTGVPADGVRDLPDVSLFAANGYNYSFYPICALPGDCSSANLNSNGTEVVTGVGGTSISSPSMAAIQALVNQSTGSWQGQANFIYYPLAARQPYGLPRRDRGRQPGALLRDFGQLRRPAPRLRTPAASTSRAATRPARATTWPPAWAPSTWPT